jgi:hypothetical protein
MIVTLWHIRAKSDNIASLLAYKESEANPAYLWLLRSLIFRRVVSSSKEIRFAWFAYDGMNKLRPDLRHCGHMPRGTECILEQWRVSCNVTALMQFEMWVHILNGWYLAESDEDAERYESQSITYQRRNLRKNWEKVYDLNWGEDKRWGPVPERSIQACTSIKSVTCIESTSFIAR